MSTGREELHKALKPLLPNPGGKPWRLHPYDKALGRPDTTVLMLSQREIRPHPVAPQGAVEVEFVVSIISPKEGGEQAEDELDDGVLALTVALRKAGIRWEKATKKVWSETLQLMTYDITGVVLTAQPDPDKE